MNKCLIVSAHLDDFELGMGGTATILSTNNYEIYLIVLCKGDRPGNEAVQNVRREACIRNCDELGIKPILYDYSDTRLDLVGQTELCNIITNHVRAIQPTIVYTHCSDDIHRDHQIISETCRVACRMRSDCTVRSLFEFPIPGSTDWGFGTNRFNVYKDISSVYNQKKKIISRYATEIKDSPDPLSLEMIESRDKYHGSICGVKYAEAFKLVYMR